MDKDEIEDIEDMSIKTIKVNSKVILRDDVKMFGVKENTFYTNIVARYGLDVQSLKNVPLYQMSVDKFDSMIADNGIPMDSVIVLEKYSDENVLLIDALPLSVNIKTLYFDDNNLSSIYEIEHVMSTLSETNNRFVYTTIGFALHSYDSGKPNYFALYNPVYNLLVLSQASVLNFDILKKILISLDTINHVYHDDMTMSTYAKMMTLTTSLLSSAFWVKVVQDPMKPLYKDSLEVVNNIIGMIREDLFDGDEINVAILHKLIGGMSVDYHKAVKHFIYILNGKGERTIEKIDINLGSMPTGFNLRYIYTEGHDTIIGFDITYNVKEYIWCGVSVPLMPTLTFKRYFNGEMRVHGNYVSQVIRKRGSDRHVNISSEVCLGDYAYEYFNPKKIVTEVLRPMIQKFRDDVLSVYNYDSSHHKLYSTEILVNDAFIFADNIRHMIRNGMKIDADTFSRKIKDAVSKFKLYDYEFVVSDELDLVWELVERTADENSQSLTYMLALLELLQLMKYECDNANISNSDISKVIEEMIDVSSMGHDIDEVIKDIAEYILDDVSDYFTLTYDNNDYDTSGIIQLLFSDSKDNESSEEQEYEVEIVTD